MEKTTLVQLKMKCATVIFLAIACFCCTVLKCNAQSFKEYNDFYQQVSKIATLDISTKCKQLLEAGVNNRDEWLIKMLDATSKIPTGLLEGNLVDYGNFDECLEISAPVVNEDTIIGKHCVGNIISIDLLGLLPNQIPKINVTSPNNLNGGTPGIGLNIIWSACIPQFCTAEDLTTVINELAEGVASFAFNENACQTKNDTFEFTPEDAAVATFFGILFALLISSTLYDVYLYYAQKKTKYDILLAFSALTNGKKLLTLNKDSTQLQCVHGIRFLSTLWVVLGHTFMFAVIQPTFNKIYLIEWMNNLHSMYILGATVSVDTFFVLSGLVMVYIYLSSVEKGVKFNVPLYYLHRYLRLTPAIIGIIFLHLTLIKYFESGPQWKDAVNLVFVQPCQKSWWTTLLYIQNYVNSDDATCLSHAWYLAVDTQLFVLSPLLLLPLSKWPKPTCIATAILTMGSILWGFLLAWFEEMDAANTVQQDPNYGRDYYIKTHTRAATWLIGVILGYVVYNTKKVGVPKIRKPIVAILWITALGTFAACLFGGHRLIMNNPISYNLVENVCFIAFLRPAWAIALCWTIYACLFGYGGPINGFLTWSPFCVASRFTYSIYIVHFTILLMRSGSVRYPTYLSEREVILTFISNFVYIATVAVLWTLLFESPIIVIEKVLFRSKKPKTEARSITGYVNKDVTVAMD